MPAAFIGAALAGLVLLEGASLQQYAVAGFFGLASCIFFILLQYVGARVFLHLTENGQVGPKLFAAGTTLLGVFGTVLGALIGYQEASLVIGFISGMLLWTGLGDIPELMGWLRPFSPRALFLLVPLAVLWSAGVVLSEHVPLAVLGAAGYPLGAWTMSLTRSLVLDRWGAGSVPATLHALLTAAVSGGAIALGVMHATPFTAIIGGMVFALGAWSVLEILWEKGTDSHPWRSGIEHGGD